MKHLPSRITALALCAASACALAQTSPRHEYRTPLRGFSVSASTPAGPSYSAEVSAGKLNFGAVLVGQSDTRQVLLTNTGTGVLTLAAPQLSGAGFTASSTCGSTLAVGASCLTEVAFAPTQAGVFNGSLSLTTNSQDASFAISIAGNAVQAEGSLVADVTASFGTVQVGSSASRTFTFTNTGTADATGVYAGLTAAGGLSLTANSCGTEASPGTVAAGQSCSMTVTWSPAASATLNSTLTVRSSAGNDPQSLALTGTAPAPVYASWNPSDKASAVTLTNANLTMSNTSLASWACARSTVGKSSGTWYWEYQVDSMPAPGTGFFVGVATSNVGLTGYGSPTTPTSVYWLSDGNRLAVNGALSNQSGATFGAGDVVGIRLTPGEQVQVYRNGVLSITQPIPAGTYYAQVCANSNNPGVITARFSPAALTYSAGITGATFGLY